MNHKNLSLNPEVNFDRIIQNFFELYDNESFKNFGEESSSIGQYPIYQKNIEQILPDIFKYGSSDKTYEESKELINKIEKNNANLQFEKRTLDKKYVEFIQQKIRENIYSIHPFKEKKKIGRKKKSDTISGEHNKFSDDNIIRRCKHIILDNILIFINKTIKELYSNESKKDIKQKLLFKLEQKQNERSKVEYNKLFLHKTIQSIFSDNISTKYSRYNPEHNKELIKKLMNEEDETKRLIFQKIFHLTFIDCLNHFRGSSFIKELEGMKNFDVYIKENNFGDNSEEYQNILKFFFDNFEKIIMEKHSRKRKNK